MAPKSCCTARSGTRPTRRRRSWCANEGLTYVHPFDDEQLIAGQGTLGLEIVQDWPEVDAVVVPIGGGGLIAGVSMAVKSFNPKIKVIGVESSDGPAMKASVDAGHLETIECKTIIDGLRVRRAGELNFSVVQRFVDEIVALPDARDLRGDDLGDGALQAGRRGRGRGAGRRAAAWAREAAAGLEGRRRAVGREPQSRSAARIEVELRLKESPREIKERRRENQNSDFLCVFALFDF